METAAGLPNLEVILQLQTKITLFSTALTMDGFEIIQSSYQQKSEDIVNSLIFVTGRDYLSDITITNSYLYVYNGIIESFSDLSLDFTYNTVIMTHLDYIFYIEVPQISCESPQSTSTIKISYNDFNGATSSNVLSELIYLVTSPVTFNFEANTFTDFECYSSPAFLTYNQLCKKDTASTFTIKDLTLSEQVSQYISFYLDFFNDTTDVSRTINIQGISLTETICKKIRHPLVALNFKSLNEIINMEDIYISNSAIHSNNFFFYLKTSGTINIDNVIMDAGSVSSNLLYVQNPQTLTMTDITLTDVVDDSLFSITGQTITMSIMNNPLIEIIGDSISTIGEGMEVSINTFLINGESTLPDSTFLSFINIQTVKLTIDDFECIDQSIRSEEVFQFINVKNLNMKNLIFEGNEGKIPLQWIFQIHDLEILEGETLMYDLDTASIKSNINLSILMINEAYSTEELLQTDDTLSTSKLQILFQSGFIESNSLFSIYSLINYVFIAIFQSGSISTEKIEVEYLDMNIESNILTSANDCLFNIKIITESFAIVSSTISSHTGCLILFQPDYQQLSKSFLYINESTFEYNYATENVSLITINEGGQMNIYDTDFNYNCGIFYGILKFDSTATTSVLSNSRFKFNSAVYGGVITLLEDSYLNIDTSTFDHNFGIIGQLVFVQQNSQITVESSTIVAPYMNHNSAFYVEESEFQSSIGNSKLLFHDYSGTISLTDLLSSSSTTNQNNFKTYVQTIFKVPDSFVTYIYTDSIINLFKNMEAANINFPIINENALFKIYESTYIYSELDYTIKSSYSTAEIIDTTFCIYERNLNQILYSIGSDITIEDSFILSKDDVTCSDYLTTFNSYNKLSLLTTSSTSSRILQNYNNKREKQTTRNKRMLATSEYSSYPDIEMFYISSYSKLNLLGSQVKGFYQRFLYSYLSEIYLYDVDLQSISAQQSETSIINILKSSVILENCIINSLSTLDNEISIINSQYNDYLTIKSTTVENLSSQFIISTDTVIEISSSTFSSLIYDAEKLIDGFVINSEDGSITIDSCDFKDITTSGKAGAIYITGELADTESVTLTITDSNFTTIKSYDDGGAIYLENANLYLETVSFELCSVDNSNSDGQGGVIFAYCDSKSIKIFCLIIIHLVPEYNKECSYDIVDSFFSDNTAELEGGAIKYNFFQPVVDELTDFEYNLATYGKDYASYAVEFELKITEENEEVIVDSTLIESTYIDYFTAPSGLEIENPFTLSLVDIYGQVVTSDSSSLATIEVMDSTVASVSKNTKVKAVDGVYTFDDFIITSTPNTIIELKVTSNALDENIITTATGLESFEIIIPMYLRYCERGEYVVNNSTCKECEAGYYSLVDNAEECSSCVDYATCNGTDQILAYYGYWRSSINSTQLYQCFHADACLGGYYSECAEGYTGNLCHACEYSASSGVKYQRKGLHRCAECPDLLGNSFIILGMVVLAIVVFFLLIRSTIQYATSDRNHEPGLLRLLIDYFHVNLILKYYDLSWPESLESALDIFSIVGEANEKIFSIECFLKGNSKIYWFYIFYFLEAEMSMVLTKSLMAMFTPIVFVIGMYLVWNFCCPCFFEQSKKQKRTQRNKFSIFQGIKEKAKKKESLEPSKKEIVLRNVVISASLLYYLSYPLIVMKTLDLFSCVTLDDGNQYLLDDISMVCWTSTHKLWIILIAVPNIIIWIIGIYQLLLLLYVGLPCYFYFKLYKNSHLLKMKDFMEYYGFFYNGLKPSHYHWFFVTTAFKMLLILINKTMLMHNLLYKALLGNLVIMTFKELVIKYKPFENDQINHLQVICANVSVRNFFIIHKIQLLTSFFGVFFALEDLRRWDLMTTEAVDLYEDTVNYPAIISAAVIMANGLFMILWLREFMILHKSYFLRKSPKPFIKWIDKITERPFNLSLMWLCAIPDNDNDPPIIGEVLTQGQDQTNLDNTLNATQQKLFNGDLSVTMATTKDASKSIEGGHYTFPKNFGKIKPVVSDISGDTNFPFNVTLHELYGNLDASEFANKVFGRETKPTQEELDKTRDISFAQYIRDLHKQDKNALSSILPDFANNDNNYLKRMLDQEIEDEQQIQQEIKISPKSNKSKRRKKIIDLANDNNFTEEYKTPIDDKVSQTDTYNNKSEIIFDEQRMAYIQMIRFGQNQPNYKNTQQTRRKAVDGQQIQNIAEIFSQDTFGNRKSQFIRNQSMKQQQQSEQESQKSELYDIYMGPQSISSPHGQTSQYFQFDSFQGTPRRNTVNLQQKILEQQDQQLKEHLQKLSQQYNNEPLNKQDSLTKNQQSFKEMEQISEEQESTPDNSVLQSQHSRDKKNNSLNKQQQNRFNWARNRNIKNENELPENSKGFNYSKKKKPILKNNKTPSGQRRRVSFQDENLSFKVSQ